MFDYYKHFNLLKIRKLGHLKGFIKKWIYIITNPKESLQKRRILNSNKPKIMWFESAYKNMYHATFQYYPSLVMLIKHMRYLGISDYFVICPKKDSYWYDAIFEELLTLQGINENKRIYIDDCNLSAKNIYYSSFPNEIPNIILPVIKQLQDSLIINDDRLNFGTRLYISRKKSQIRFLSNEDEIKNILEKEYGFKTIYMEDYNLKEKINIMKNAKIVLSIDGTSLVNTLFSKKQCKMIGLRLHSLTEHMFVMSAMFDNISYLPIICDLDEEIFDKGYNNDCQWHSSNLYINPAYLREKLEAYEVYKI